jgi:hypothetical protein
LSGEIHLFGVGKGSTHNVLVLHVFDGLSSTLLIELFYFVKVDNGSLNIGVVVVGSFDK